MKKICLFFTLFSCSGLLLNNSFASSNTTPTADQQQMPEQLLTGLIDIMKALKDTKKQSLKGIATVINEIVQCLETSNFEKLKTCFTQLNNGITALLDKADTAEMNGRLGEMIDVLKTCTSSIQDTHDKILEINNTITNENAQRTEAILADIEKLAQFLSGNINDLRQNIQGQIQEELEAIRAELSRLWDAIGEQNQQQFPANQQLHDSDLSRTSSVTLNQRDSIRTLNFPDNEVNPKASLTDSSLFETNNLPKINTNSPKKQQTQTNHQGSKIYTLQEAADYFNKKTFKLETTKVGGEVLTVLVDQQGNIVEIRNDWKNYISGKKTVGVYYSEFMENFFAFDVDKPSRSFSLGPTLHSQD